MIAFLIVFVSHSFADLFLDVQYLNIFYSILGAGDQGVRMFFVLMDFS